MNRIIYIFHLYYAFYRVTQKEYSCLVNRKMHNKRGIFKIKIVLNYQGANLILIYWL